MDRATAMEDHVMTRSQVSFIWHLLTCKSVWCTVLIAAVCAVLAYDQSWKACIGMLIVLVVVLLALNEDVHDYETETPPNAG
jgi:fumarate reductase subunit D